MAKNNMVRLLAVLLFIGTVSVANAQGPGGPGSPGPDPDPGPGTSVPFDGGLSLVVAAGIAYAAKKGYDKKAKSRKEEVEK